MESILGLDLGTSSVGWAIIQHDHVDGEVVASGVRIFPEGMDRSRGEKSRNQDRREARQLRRQTYRRVRRKAKLKSLLQCNALLPKDEVRLGILFNQHNPYELRSKGLVEQLTAHQFGRVLYHLGQRRGYLSNRKTGSDKDGAVAAGIGEVQRAMSEAGAETLGQYLNACAQEKGHKLRGIYTSRKMYQKEFLALWDQQEQYLPQLRKAGLKQKVFDAIFDQRPLRVQKHLIGWCEFEPNRKRCMSAALVAQEFRLWQSINNLKIEYANGDERPLNDKERLLLHGKLKNKASIPWKSIRTALNLLDTDGFNLERSSKTGMQGNKTQALLRNAIGAKRWDGLNARGKEQVTNDLITIANDDAIRKRLINHWQCDEVVAQKVMDAGLKLPKGTMHLSSAAMRKLVSAMSAAASEQNRGPRYDEACQMVGYHDSKKAAHTGLNKLPPLSQDLRNPLVTRTLGQVRHLVNAIVREHGKPDRIRIELARDLKLSAKQREAARKMSALREKENIEARAFFEEFENGKAIPNPSRTDLLKYRLWQECGRVCPYTGESIGAADLFGEHPRFQIEHILPYSRCLNDSFANKTLCADKVNAQKGKLTPFEFFNGRPSEWAQVQQRLKFTKMSFRKRQWFLKSDLPEDLPADSDFVSQQLNETRYIATASVQYLQQLGVPVECVKGGTTAILRHSWGLDHILGEGVKTRKDHRHHAVDAIAIGLTSRKAVHRLSRFHSFTGGRMRYPDLACPVSGLREKAQRSVENIVVSHSVSRRVRGQLHDDTLYSNTGEMSESGGVVVAIRKPLGSIKAADLEKIRDERTKRIVQNHLRANGGSLSSAFKDPENPCGFYTRAGDFMPIHSVRLLETRSVIAVGEAERQRWVWSRGNSHMEVFAIKDKKGHLKWVSNVVRLIDAYKRKGEHQPVVNRQMDGATFVMSLKIGEMLAIELDGQEQLVRVQKMDQSGKLVMRLHTDADSENSKLEIRRNIEPLRKMNARKVCVDVLGKITRQND